MVVEVTVDIRTDDVAVDKLVGFAGVVPDDFTVVVVCERVGETCRCFVKEFDRCRRECAGQCRSDAFGRLGIVGEDCAVFKTVDDGGVGG